MHRSLVKQKQRNVLPERCCQIAFHWASWPRPPPLKDTHNLTHAHTFIYILTQHRQAAAEIPAQARSDGGLPDICASWASWWRCWCVRLFGGWTTGHRDQHMHACIYKESIMKFLLHTVSWYILNSSAWGDEDIGMSPISAAVVTTFNHKSCHKKPWLEVTALCVVDF